MVVTAGLVLVGATAAAATEIPDPAFDTGSGFDRFVYSIDETSDGKILATGYFTTFDGDAAPYVVRLNSDGSRDTSFQLAGTGLNAGGLVVLEQSDGKILVGGDFTGLNGETAGKLVRLNADGSRDMTFALPGAGFNTSVYALAETSDGKILVGGAFENLDGVAATRLVRLNADGSRDTTFSLPGTGLNNTVRAIVPTSDGKVVVGGNFTALDGESAGYALRLNADGSRDTTYALPDGGFSRNVVGMTETADGKVLVGGAFTALGGESAQRMARLNADGSRDTSFTLAGTGFSSTVFTVAEAADGKILAGGLFTALDGESAQRIARLNADGSRDTTFTTGVGFGSTVYTVAPASDGAALVGGNFTSFDNQTARYLTRLVTQVLDFTSPVSAGIDGTARVGETLTADIEVDSDPAASSYTYQWLRDGAAISGATGEAYTLTVDDEDTEISVTITPVLADYDSASGEGTSAAVTIGAGAFAESPVVEIPTEIRVGAEVSATITSDSDPAASSYTYQWFQILDDDSIVAIDGATSTTYTPVPADEGLRIGVRVTPHLAGYDSTDAFGESSAVRVDAGAFTSAVDVSLTDAPVVGTPVGAQIDADAVPAATSYTYQWLRDGEPIDGATSDGYTPIAADESTDLSVVVTPVLDGYDSASGAGTSAAAEVAPGAFEPGATVELPADVRVGVEIDSTVSAASPTPSSYEYQWFRVDGVGARIAIDGATDAAYTPTAADEGFTLALDVTPVLAGYAGEAATDTTGVVQPGLFSSVVVAEIDGDAVGLPMTATVAFAPLPTPSEYTYQWLRDGEPIDGETADTFVPTADDIGDEIAVRVTPVLAGYDSASGAGVSASVVVAEPTVGVAGSTTVAAGEDVTVSGSGFTPGEVLTVELHSTVVVLGTVTADSTGSFREAFTIPASTEAGLHHLVFLNAAEETVGEVEITVTASGALPVTGSDAGGAFWAAGLAVAALVAGGLLIAVRRRQVAD